MCSRIYVCTYINIHTYVHMYIYMCIHTYIHTYKHTHRHTHTQTQPTEGHQILTFSFFVVGRRGRGSCDERTWMDHRCGAAPRLRRRILPFRPHGLFGHEKTRISAGAAQGPRRCVQSVDGDTTHLYGDRHDLVDM